MPTTTVDDDNDLVNDWPFNNETVSNQRLSSFHSLDGSFKLDKRLSSSLDIKINVTIIQSIFHKIDELRNTN